MVGIDRYRQNCASTHVSKDIRVHKLHGMVPDNIDGGNLLDTGRCRQYNAFTFTHMDAISGSNIVDNGRCRQNYSSQSTHISKIQYIPDTIGGCNMV
jgi:hypothetical protein